MTDGTDGEPFKGGATLLADWEGPEGETICMPSWRTQPDRKANYGGGGVSVRRLSFTSGQQLRSCSFAAEGDALEMG